MSTIPVAEPLEQNSIQPSPPAALPAPAPEPAPPVPEGFAKFAETVKPGDRLVSLDAYRGFIMLVMASGGLAIPEVVKALAKANPEGGVSPTWQFLAFHTDHVPWVGCSFWDLIQPSFMFMVGVALPYSYASRVAKGQRPVKIYAHALWRSLLLVFLGVFLSSNWSKQTNFTFVNVLSQIGLGYFFLYFLVGRGLFVQSLALAVILGGYGYWFFSHPLPPEGFDLKSVGLPANWPLLEGVFAHWNKNVNAAADFDLWFLNLFPREAPFCFNSGGYQTLNFIPSLGTMLFGLMAGELLRSQEYTNIEKFLRLTFVGLIFVVVGMVLGEMVCPNVKRIWTPTWTIYSSGFTFLMLAGFYLVIDLWGFKKWTWPLLVVGMNSIAIYCIAQLMKSWLGSTLKIHLGQDIFNGTYFGRQWFAPEFAPIAQSAAVLLAMWLICVWMYRQKIFIRI